MMTPEERTRITLYLPIDHPLFPRWLSASQLEPDERARQLSAVLVRTCPPGNFGKPGECSEHLQGMGAAHTVQAVVAQAMDERVKPHINRADAVADRFMASNDLLEQKKKQRGELADEAVDWISGRISRAQNRDRIGLYQELAAQREVGGKYEHLHAPGAGWKGHAVAAIVAVLEIVVTLRIFNVDLTHLHPASFFPWLAATALLALFNTCVAAYLGSCRRSARESVDAAFELHGREAAQAHRSAIADDNGHHGRFYAGSPAGLAPRTQEVREIAFRRSVAFTLFFVPLAILLMAMYWRLGKMTVPLDLGIFGWLVPAVIVGIVGALQWTLVVEPNSRGNILGDYLREAKRIDDESVTKDRQLLSDAQQAAQAGPKYVETVKGVLLEAEEEVAAALDVVHRGFQIAYVTLGVDTMGNVRPENLVRPSERQLERIRSRVQEQVDRLVALADDLDRPALPPLKEPSTAMGIFALPRHAHADPLWVPDSAVPSYPPSTLRRPKVLTPREAARSERRAGWTLFGLRPR
ncbi:hypothetical protein [Nocardia amamiensis]|uniref:hypothetical protein n=1 Tax=Nocardia TaxID=1817 RepID=UPI0033CBE495